VSANASHFVTIKHNKEKKNGKKQQLRKQQPKMQGLQGKNAAS